MRYRAGAGVDRVAPEVAEILLKRLGGDLDGRAAIVVRSEGGTIGANELRGHASVSGVDHLPPSAFAKRQALRAVLQDFRALHERPGPHNGPANGLRFIARHR
jgi:hypothetical protein